ncbi:MAG TPA: DUF5522 domain-containing protein [Parasegetibacter sp.]|jgi:hypothetical protein
MYKKTEAGLMKKLEEGIDFYYNDEGYIVLTEKYHLDKGWCCGNGCLHCPYDFESVPEPVRTMLLEERMKKPEQKQG